MNLYNVELAQAISLVSRNTLRRGEHLDAIFVHALKDLEQEVLSFAVFHRRNSRLVLNGIGAEECARRNIDYQGRESWEAILANIPFLLDVGALWTTPASHTYAEAEAVQRMAMEREWFHIGIMATPYHILRCTLTQLAARKRCGAQTRIYPMTLRSIDWNATVTRRILDGDTVTHTRLELWEGELKRIEAYQKKDPPDCVSFAEMIDYFQAADATAPDRSRVAI